MRITAEAREETRERLLRAGAELFRSKGFEATTTRDLADAAGIAAGTLFNYFPGKEALGMALVTRALEEGRARFRRRRRRGSSVAEEMFALVAAELRALESCRPFAAPVLETGLSPFACSAAAPAGDTCRLGHLEAVAAIFHHLGVALPGAFAMHLYWTLYVGVLAFWTRDDSPRGEDTRLVLDQTLRLFSSTLDATSSASSTVKGATS